MKRKLEALCVALLAASVAQASVVFIEGATGGGNFETGTSIGTTGANLSSATTHTWNFGSTEPDWAITGGQAVADSVAGTGLGQIFLQSNYGSAWAGMTDLAISLDWTTLAAGDTLQVGLAGWKNTGTGVNTYGLNSGTIINSASHYGTGTSLTAATLVSAGSGASGSGTYTDTIDISAISGVTDLADFDALAVIFFSTVDAGGGKVTLDNVQLSAIPEPATLGLVVAFGGGLLFVRRMLAM